MIRLQQKRKVFRNLSVLLSLAAFGAAVACGNASNGSEAPRAWSTAPRTLDYSIDETHGADARSFELGLDFGPDDVTVTELGTPVHAKMNASGRLSYSLGDGQPAAIYELIALSILPPTTSALHVGDTWSYTRPDDAEAIASPGVVAQERFDYEITSLDSDKVVVAVKGFLRIAPSAGLKSVLAAHQLSEDVAPLVGIYRPYVDGNAEFDRRSGETLRASGTRVPFAFMDATAPAPNESPAGVRYVLVRN